MFRMPYANLPPDLRKSFEVSLHAGSTAALLLSSRRYRPSARFAFTSCLPAAIVGGIYGRTIERKFGSERLTPIGLIAGSAALIVADHFGSNSRTASEVTTRDGLTIGLAQACALMPGVSRQGAAITAARASGFSRKEAQVLADKSSTPILIAATSYKALQLARNRLPHGLRRGFITGTTASFISALACVPLLGKSTRLRSPKFWATYRLGVAAATVFANRRSRP